MRLTKEECENAYNDIKMANDYPTSKYNDSRLIDFALRIFEQLIEEHYDLVELLKKHDLENLSIKELDTWFDRSLWHVNKVNELSNQLVELSREVKSKDEYITELRNYITQIEREFKDNPPLKFEELKENMWVWDNDYKLYCLIDRIYSFNKFSVNYHFNTMQQFEENRFYRMEVKTDG